MLLWKIAELFIFKSIFYSMHSIWRNRKTHIRTFFLMLGVNLLLRENFLIFKFYTV